MHFTLQFTALSSLFLVLTHSTLLSSVYAAPLDAREDRYTGHTVDKQGNPVAVASGKSLVKVPWLRVDKNIKEIFKLALPDAKLDYDLNPLPISEETVDDKNQMMYVKIAGAGCNPCYLWSARSDRHYRFGALLRRVGPGHVESVGGVKNGETGRQVWMNRLNDRVLKEFEPLKGLSWTESAAGKGSASAKTLESGSAAGEGSGSAKKTLELGRTGTGGGKDPKMSLGYILNDHEEE